MKTHSISRIKGFTLMETVIAIGVLAVLLTGFVAVFAPATNGIKRSISMQEADRLASAFEQELSILRDQTSSSSAAGNAEPTTRSLETSTEELGASHSKSGSASSYSRTSFEKAFDWIRDSKKAENALLAFLYRANIAKKRNDGTGEPYTAKGGQPGRDYVVQPMVRPVTDKETAEDLAALEGNLFVIKCKQLIFEHNGGPEATMKVSSADEFENSDRTTAVDVDNFTDGAIAVEASFYSLPSRTPEYLKGAAFQKRFPTLNNPVFIRNFAINR